MRLHEVEAARSRQLRAHRAREAAVAPEAAEVERVEHDRGRGALGPAARDEREGAPGRRARRWPDCTKRSAPPNASKRRRTRATRGPLVPRPRVVGLTAARGLVDRRVHPSTGSCVRHSLTLLPPQVVAARAAGVAARDDAMRHHPRAPFAHAARPEERHHGVPMAAAMCIGAESTPKKSRARAAERPHLAQRQLPGEVRHRDAGALEDALHDGLLARVGRAGEHEAVPVPGQALQELGVALVGPRLEEPARGRVDVQEALGRQAVLREEGIDLRLRLGAGNHHEALLVLGGIQPHAAKGVEIQLHGVPGRPPGHRVAVREAGLPEPARARRRDRPARAQELGEPCPAPVVREVDDELVAALAQLRKKRRLAPHLQQEPLPLPLRVDRVDARDGGVAASMSRVSTYTRASISACGARSASTLKTGEVSSTSPWWRSLTTSTRRSESTPIGSGTMAARLANGHGRGEGEPAQAPRTGRSGAGPRGAS